MSNSKGDNGKNGNNRVQSKDDTRQDKQASNREGSHIPFISDQNPSSKIQKIYSQYSHYVLDQLCNEILETLGVNLCGESGYGKTYLAFHLARKLEQREDSACKIFSPSNIWEKRMGKGVFLVRVGTQKFNPVDRDGNLNLEPYEIEWLARQLLRKETVVFKIEYHKPERILGFLVLCLRILFSHNEQKVLNEQPHYHYVCFLEEAHTMFKSGSLHGDKKNEMLKYVSLGRSDADMHFVNITQRLAEVDVSLCERLGLVTTCQVGQNAIRKVKSNLPKQLKKRILLLKKREFLWFNARGIIFWSPDYKFSGKPRRTFPHKPEPEPKKSFWDRFKKTEKSPLPFSNNFESTDEYDHSYGEDSWEQEDDEFTEEIDSEFGDEDDFTPM